jgi:CRP/FNR family transcriptional regulator, nitrogen oxide reductase regulator
MASDSHIKGKLGRARVSISQNMSVPARVASTNSLIREPLQSWAIRLQHLGLFSGLSGQDCAEVIRLSYARNFSRGQMIYKMGDSEKQVVLLTSGSAKMVHYGQNGSAVILRICARGDLMGALGTLLLDRDRSTPEALSAGSALVWDRESFHSLCKRFPNIRFNVGTALVKQLEDMEDRFRELSTERVAYRLSRQVFRLAEKIGIHSNGSTEINLTREELAQLIGTTLFTVSRLLSEWDRQGFVITRREGFTIVDMKSLERIIE